MEITSAHVRDFQSIKDVEINFGSFTVLVGPSSSGKSAFLRAVRACLRNTAVPANVRQGAVKSLVDVTFKDGSIVQIERGKSLSTYRLTQGKTLETFSKSGRAVPAEITKVIQIPLIAEVDATFSFQFDRPFLLAETGSLAAQVIGSLTNVSLLHAATREANRRRGEAVSTLRIRKVDASRYKERAQEYSDLPARKAALDQAEQQLSTLSELEGKLRRLRELSAGIRKAAEDLSVLEAVQPPDVTDQVEEVTELNAKLTRVEGCAKKAGSLRAEILTKAERVKSLKQQLVQMDEEYEAHLKRLGQCPVCGADTSS